MKIGLLSCGAMGSIYAGNLSKAHEVYVFDTWKDNVDAINEKGITIDELDGSSATYKIAKAATDANELETVDILLVFTRYDLIVDTMKSAKKLFDDHTIVMSLQNGMGNLDEIAKVVPKEQMCCGTTAHGSLLLGPGHVRHTGVGVTAVGSYAGDKAKAETVVKAFSEAGFDIEAKDNVMQVIWHKMFANIAINAITALLEAPNASVAENEYERAFAEMLVREGLAVAKASGCDFDDEAEIKTAFDVAIATGPNKSSMLQSVLNKRATEIRIINGAVVKMGKQLGIPTPYNEAISYLIEAKQSFYLNK